MTQLIRGWTKHLTPPGTGWQRTDPLDRGLLGEWRFDHDTGLMLPDYSSYKRHGIVIGPDWVTTEVGPALRFAGAAAADYVDLRNTFPANFSLDNFTLEAYVRLTAGAMADDAMIFGWRVADDPTIIFLAFDDAGFIGNYGIYSKHLGNAKVYSNTAINDGAWHHIEVVAQGNFCYCYLDGKPDGGEAIVAATAAAFDVADAPFIGDDPGATEQWDGDIALVRFYNRAHTAAEVRARYQICLKRAQPLTYAWMIPSGRSPVAPPVGGHMTLWGRYWGP